MNLPNETTQLIISSLSTRDVFVFSSVCKKIQSIVTSLSSLFWLSKVKIIEHAYFENYSIALVQKVSHALDTYECTHEFIFAVRDVDIIPWIQENCKMKLKLIYKYDNDVLLANYLLINESSYLPYHPSLILEHNSVRCFRWIRKHLTENESTDLALKDFLSKLLLEKPKSLYNFLKTAWDNIESTACELSWMFSFYSSDTKDILIWLLGYPSLFDCNPWEQIIILLTCASDDELWSELFGVHYTSRIKLDYKNSLYPESIYSWIYIVNQRKDIPIFQRAYDKMLSTVSWEDWDDIHKPKSIRKLRSNMNAVEVRLAGTVSREHIKRLLY